MTGVLPALAVLVGAGAFYQLIGSARYRRTFTPPGRMLDVGGHRVHVLCSGVGTPAVVFESGIAASSLSWSIVQPAVAEFTRACAYDRAGLGWSDAPSCPRRFERVVDEFAAMVSHVARGGRCVLVGHSYGAFVVRAYAGRFPEQVAALVLIDPALEWLTLTPQRARMLLGGQRLAQIGAVLARVGVVRACLALLTGGAPAAPRHFVKVFGPTAAATLERLVGEVRKLPSSVHPIVQGHWSQPKCFHAMADYFRALAMDSATIGTLVPPRELPVTVISSRQQPPDQIAAHRALAQTSLRGMHVTAERSGHWVQFDEPELVVRVIRHLIEADRIHGARPH